MNNKKSINAFHAFVENKYPRSDTDNQIIDKSPVDLSNVNIIDP